MASRSISKQLKNNKVAELTHSSAFHRKGEIKMAQIIDITGRITNELPMVRITNSLVITVNNRKNTIMNIQAMIAQEQAKAETFDELKMIRKTIDMLAGKKAADEVEALDLPLPEYKLVYQAIMAAATGDSMEDVERRFQ